MVLFKSAPEGGPFKIDLLHTAYSELIQTTLCIEVKTNIALANKIQEDKRF